MHVRTSPFWWTRPLTCGLVFLLFLVAGLRSLPHDEENASAKQAQAYAVPHFRTVVFLLDSVGTPMAFDPQLMPFVSSLSSTSLFGEAHACPGHATFPCVKSIFEGRTATTGTGLQDFSAVVSQRTSWPRSLAALGLRVVLTSDHTLNRLYPDAFAEAMNYETLHASLLERDAFAYARARQWLDDPATDVLLLHIIGTDKVAHEYPVGGDVYRAKYREVDAFVREVVSRLSPNDYFYVIGDHGHDALGGHTLDAVYIAHGAIFPQGQNENLSAPDMLFLLSIPYGLLLPSEYEGQVRTDLTLLAEAERSEYLRAQAATWNLDSSGSTGELEARLNQHVAATKTEGQAAKAWLKVARLAPWIFAAAFLLFAFGSSADFDRREMTLLAAAAVCALVSAPVTAVVAAIVCALLCGMRIGVVRTFALAIAFAAVAVFVFRFEPAWLKWYQHLPHQPIAFAVFYSSALLIGIVWARWRGAQPLQASAVQVLWFVGLAVWLVAYFGPYAGGLTGHAAKLVLPILPPLAIALAGGYRALCNVRALQLLCIWPFALFRTESYNIRYRLSDWLSDKPLFIGLALCVCLALVLAVGTKHNRVLRFGLICAWIAIAAFFFQFSSAILLAALFGAIWLEGALELFKRVKLPAAWAALTAAALLFVVLHFALNGFALSHVDFHFAANKIIPFREEIYRATEMILWALVKYAFVLLPVFAVLLRLCTAEMAAQIFQLGIWRELMLVISALGLALFDPRGLNELCAEELYFWTFLNALIWSFWLLLSWRQRRVAEALASPGESAVAFHGLATKLQP